VTIQDEKTSPTFNAKTNTAATEAGELDQRGVMRRDLLRNTAALGGLSLLNLPLVGNAAEHSAATNSAAAAAPASRIAFQQMLQTLGQIDSEYLSPAWGVTSDVDIAEGYRMMMHLLDVGTRLYFEGDPNRPEFQPMVSPTIKIQGDNPDALYFYTRIRGDRNYRIRGKRVGEVYLSFTVHSGDGNGGWATGVDAARNMRQIQFADDGSFELLVGPTVDPERGLRTSAHSQEIVTRHYFERELSAQLDSTVRPLLLIEALDADVPGTAPSDADIARRLQTVSNFLVANSTGRPKPDPKKMPSWFSIIPNQLGKPMRWSSSDGGGLGAVDNAYSAGRFVLAPEQALIIEGRLPNCVFANVVLWNRYLQSFEYRYRRISLNRKQMRLESDGSYRIIVAHRDPGLPNWLSTEGRATGTVYWRFLLSEGDIDAPRTRLVNFSEIKTPA
jgi:hypothetical protein